MVGEGKSGKSGAGSDLVSDVHGRTAPHSQPRTPSTSKMERAQNLRYYARVSHSR